MKQLLLFLIPVILICCNKSKTQLTAESSPVAVTQKIPEYPDFKKDVLIHKKQYSDSSHTTVSDYLFHLINEDIYTYWKGTAWSFNGMTQTPKEGTIACGYFVTNTLYDLGFRIERLKLAQCASGEMIKVLCTDIHSFNGLKNFAAYMEKQPGNSAYIVGLDYHTGYIVKDSTGCYFLHSNYIFRQGVVKEKINESRALANNKFFMIGSLTANKKLLKQWVAD